jgi:hypothetical protein
MPAQQMGIALADKLPIYKSAVLEENVRQHATILIVLLRTDLKYYHTAQHQFSVIIPCLFTKWFSWLVAVGYFRCIYTHIPNPLTSFQYNRITIIHPSYQSPHLGSRCQVS